MYIFIRFCNRQHTRHKDVIVDIVTTYTCNACFSFYWKFLFSLSILCFVPQGYIFFVIILFDFVFIFTTFIWEIVFASFMHWCWRCCCPIVFITHVEVNVPIVRPKAKTNIRAHGYISIDVYIAPTSLWSMFFFYLISFPRQKEKHSNEHQTNKQTNRADSFHLCPELWLHKK